LRGGGKRNRKNEREIERERERESVKFGGSYGCENVVFYAEERVGMLVEGSWNAATDGESKSVKSVLTYTCWS